MSARTIIVAAALVLASQRSALADPSADAQAAPASHAVSPCGGDYLSLSGLSDYRFDGFSESNRQPTWQVTGYCYNAQGYFVGATFTGVDFEDTPRTHFEADWYAGRQFQRGPYSVTVTLLYASFPDQRTASPSYNIFEPEAEVSRTFKKLTVKGLAAWSTSATSHSWHLKGTLAYQLTPWLRLDADAAHFWGEEGASHDTWDVGATANWRRFTLGAHYGGTTQSPAQCFFTDWCAPGPMVSLSYRVLP